MRNRSVLRPGQNRGQACPKLQETNECNSKECPGTFNCQSNTWPIKHISFSVDCKLNEWTSWSLCTRTCGGGTQMRKRSVLRPGQNGGQACPNFVETNECNTKECPGTFNCQLNTLQTNNNSISVDCNLQWTSWSSCTKTCSGGTKLRNKYVMRSDQHGGQACLKLRQTYECNRKECAGNQLTARPWILIYISLYCSRRGEESVSCSEILSVT